MNNKPHIYYNRGKLIYGIVQTLLSIFFFLWVLFSGSGGTALLRDGFSISDFLFFSFKLLVILFFLRTGIHNISDNLLIRRTPVDCSRLFIMADRGDLEGIKGFFKETGRVFVNWRDPQFNTMLNYAAEKGRLEMAEYLLSSGADKNNINSEGKTPLIAAAENGHYEVVKLLVECGADIHVKTPPRLYVGNSMMKNREMTAHDFAVYNSHDDIAFFLKENNYSR